MELAEIQKQIREEREVLRRVLREHEWKLRYIIAHIEEQNYGMAKETALDARHELLAAAYSRFGFHVTEDGI